MRQSRLIYSPSPFPVGSNEPVTATSGMVCSPAGVWYILVMVDAQAAVAAAAWWVRWLELSAFTVGEAEIVVHRAMRHYHNAPAGSGVVGDDVEPVLSAIAVGLVSPSQVEEFHDTLLRHLYASGLPVEDHQVMPGQGQTWWTVAEALATVTVRWRMRITAGGAVVVWVAPVSSPSPVGEAPPPSSVVIWPPGPDTSRQVAEVEAVAQWWHSVAWADVLIGSARSARGPAAGAVTALGDADQRAVAALIAAAIRRAGRRLRLTTRHDWRAVIAAGMVNMATIRAALDPADLDATLASAPPTDLVGSAWQPLTDATRPDLVAAARTVIQEWITRAAGPDPSPDRAFLLDPAPDGYARPDRGAYLLPDDPCPPEPESRR